MFKQRSSTKEMMDGETDAAILRKNYAEIEKVNTFLGGYGTLLKGLSELMEPGGAYHLVDIGCGAGDNINSILIWAAKKEIQLSITGVDISSTAVQMSQERFKGMTHVKIIEQDYRDYMGSPDVICSCLFNHHLTDEENKAYFLWVSSASKVGFVVNDLHRHPLAYYSIKWIAQIMNTSIYFKNDAPLSVLRAFSKKELRNYLPVGIGKIKWRWAFRWLVIGKING